MQALSLTGPKLTTRNLVYMAMFMAMQIVLGRLSFGTSFLKFSPAFFATILMAYYLGPWLSGLTAAFTDQLSTIVFNPGANFPPFTLSAVLAAIIYGVFFYNKKVTVWRVVTAVGLVIVVVNIFMNTLWIDMLGTPWQGIIGIRTVKNLAMWPIQAFLSYATLRAVERIKPHLN
ncbi:folate family ECF transporter S component [Lacticaseibacillus kribbianus]|uniref:folate family ECF transporter S component n=1 Tax=Lacticaseibacillus kribbianus TaxID=2926292 RepID=UPI001CD2C064|nr:folate family ECF transporter S component [Lacticaseibacillus kribbianus]